MCHHRHWAKEVFISRGVTLRARMLTLWLSRGWVFEEAAEGFGLLVPGRMRDSHKQLSRLGVEGSVSLVSGFFFFLCFRLLFVVFQLGCHSRINKGKKMQGDECRRSLFLHSFLFLQDKRKTCLEMICLLVGFFASLPEGREWCRQEQACRPFLEVGGSTTCAFSEAAAHQAENGFWRLCMELAVPWRGDSFIIGARALPHKKEGCYLWPPNVRTASPLNPQVRRYL